MLSLIVTGSNRGKVKDLEHEAPNHYKDEDGFLYTEKDFVSLDMIEHEEHKSELLVQYWQKVNTTIKEYLYGQV